MKTIRVSKVLMKSLRLIKCLPVLYMWLNVSLCWGLSVCLQPLLWGLQTGTWSLYFVPCDGYFFTALANKRCWNCSLCQLTAVADCSELPLGQSGSKRALQHFSDCQWVLPSTLTHHQKTLLLLWTPVNHALNLLPFRYTAKHTGTRCNISDALAYRCDGFIEAPQLVKLSLECRNEWQKGFWRFGFLSYYFTMIWLPIK